MFYVKHKTEDVEVKAYIYDDNVYTTCPCCGKEHMVDLVEILKGGESDLFGTSVFCLECSTKAVAK